MSAIPQTITVIILGTKEVGKTFLCEKFGDCFRGTYTPTRSFYTPAVYISTPGNGMLRVQLRELTLDFYAQRLRSSLSGGDVVLLLYDPYDSDSCHCVIKMFNEITQYNLDIERGIIMDGKEKSIEIVIIAVDNPLKTAYNNTITNETMILNDEINLLRPNQTLYEQPEQEQKSNHLLKLNMSTWEGFEELKQLINHVRAKKTFGGIGNNHNGDIGQHLDVDYENNDKNDDKPSYQCCII